jgi:cell wall-associated NlpC family hydrolase
MSTTARVAAHARAVALQGVAQAAKIHYTQNAVLRWDGINHHHTGRNQPDYADCSAYATWVEWWSRIYIRGRAGLDVMNDQDWRSGWTGTLLQHGKRHRAGMTYWYPGRTLVFYGKPTVEHVAIYVGGGKVVSHGNEAGPLLLPVGYRSDMNQARAYTV